MKPTYIIYKFASYVKYDKLSTIFRTIKITKMFASYVKYDKLSTWIMLERASTSFASYVKYDKLSTYDCIISEWLSLLVMLNTIS